MIHQPHGFPSRHNCGGLVFLKKDDMHMSHVWHDWRQFVTLFDAGLFNNISVVAAQPIMSTRLRRTTQSGWEGAKPVSCLGSSRLMLSDITSVARGNGAAALVYGAFRVHSVFQTACRISECISVCLLMSEPTVDTIEIYSFTSDHEAKLKRPCE